MKSSSFQANIAKQESLVIWYEKMAHHNIAQFKNILQKMVILFQDEKFKCVPCILAKIHKSPFRQSDSRFVRAGELMDADLSGPMQVDSLGGGRYFLLLKDNYSHWRTAYLIKQKSETSKSLEDYVKKSKKHLKKRIKIIRTDNGLGFINHKAEDLYHRLGMTH